MGSIAMHGATRARAVRQTHSSVRTSTLKQIVHRKGKSAATMRSLKSKQLLHQTSSVLHRNHAVMESLSLNRTRKERLNVNVPSFQSACRANTSTWLLPLQQTVFAMRAMAVLHPTTGVALPPQRVQPPPPPLPPPPARQRQSPRRQPSPPPPRRRRQARHP